MLFIKENMPNRNCLSLWHLEYLNLSVIKLCEVDNLNQINANSRANLA